ncbi:BspA family leucine-rich repeat surface protein [Segatella copri]|uniref:BspA family leucine-rich repeat surface protein n=1 Tax=Segatella copri TaxID=165179 RepID=UPI0020CC6EF0|nr:BspA family leucine-rich repeat surface protein [Segatella copri]MCP9514912.1 BspA family leucine-rich repeat surface protein [Segatella copri]MCP9518354.1 BspA family leucine-rich repeat surface protein [Segatella copri]
MKKFTNQFNGSHADRINNGGGRFRRIALFPLMLFMLLLVPTSMMAQTDYDNTVTFTALAGNPQGFPNETYAELFDGKKTKDKFSKWCCKFSRSANVIFAASKAGVPVGYTITTGNDNFTSKGRNPMSWKLYGNNVGKDGEWTLIQEVNNDTKLQDVNYTSYDFTCGGGKSYKYFKWEISAIHSGDVLQVGEFELKLQTCTHTNADGSSALGNAIKTVETTCTEHGYTTYKCSICHSTVKKYKTDELKKHTLTYHEAKDGVKEHWQCDVCHKYFSDADATQEVSYASLLYPAYAVFEGSTGTLTFKCSPSKPERAYDLNREWSAINENIKKVVFDASFANARPTSCDHWFDYCPNLTTIEGIEYFNTENVTNMRYMFGDCRSLKSLDLTNFNTENVTDMYYMFHNCRSLESLDLTNFNTAKVTNMKGMFSSCYALKTIYASDKFVTDQVTESTCMFSDCLNLKDYSSSKEDHTYANCGPTGYFTYGRGYAMFDDATGTLTFSYKGFKSEGAYELNEGGGNTPEWISKNSYVKKVVFDASFANTRPTSCFSWFRGCENLTTIEGIEYLNTENVENMSSMFRDCYALESLDLSSFNTAKVTSMSRMFYICKALTTIYASDKFVTNQVTNGNDMFYGCEKLNGYDGSKTNYKYANYKTGYFSKLVGKNGDEKIGASGETLTAASLALDDEKDFVAYEPFSAKAASYSREMKEGTIWATLCLPFEVSLADKNFRAFKLLSANESTSTIQLEEITTSIAAGTPVIIKMNNGETTLSISEANKEIAQKVVSAADGNYQLQGIYTQKVFDKDADNNCYIVKGDKLMNPTKLLENTSTTQVGSMPFRAYMVDNTSSSAGAKMFSIAIGDNTTAIDSLNTIADDKAVYYDLQGNRLSAPQKGINIVKRGSKTMKVIIK